MLCSLVQFRTTNNRCRRCSAGLDLPPVTEIAAGPPPAVEEHVLDVAGAIRSLRRSQGLSQRQLALRMQVPRTYVSKIENDKAKPTISSLQRLAAAMETDVARLLGATGDGGAALDQVRDLVTDSFVRELLPYVSKLAPAQMNQVLSQLRLMAARPKTD